MEKAVYITDLDGTLLNSSSKLSNYTKSKLKTLLNNGLNFTVSTLRSHASIKNLFDGIDLKLPIIEQNGALLTRFHDNNKLLFNSITDSYKQKILTILEEEKVDPVFLTYSKKDKLAYGKLSSPGLKWYYESRINAKDKRVVTYSNMFELIKDKWMGIFVIDDYVKGFKIEERLKKEFSGNLNINITEALQTPENPWLSIGSVNASKKNGILQLKEMNNLHKHRIVCFGDQPVDIPMFEVADLSVAVSNAHKDVKAKADIVIGHHDENSVINFIEEDYANNI